MTYKTLKKKVLTETNKTKFIAFTERITYSHDVIERITNLHNVISNATNFKDSIHNSSAVFYK